MTVDVHSFRSFFIDVVSFICQKFIVIVFFVSDFDEHRYFTNQLFFFHFLQFSRQTQVSWIFCFFFAFFEHVSHEYLTRSSFFLYFVESHFRQSSHQFFAFFSRVSITSHTHSARIYRFFFAFLNQCSRQQSCEFIVFLFSFFRLTRHTDFICLRLFFDLFHKFVIQSLMRLSRSCHFFEF